MEPALAILSASSQASLTLTLMAGAGAFLTRLNLLDQRTSSVISKLLASFLIPCMLFVSIAPYMSWSNLVLYWLLPVSIIVYAVVGIALGYAVARIAGIDSDMYRFVAIACSFGNTTSLPLALASSLATMVVVLSNRMDFRPLEMGMPVDDTPSKALARGVAYVFIVTLMSTFMRWTFLYRMLAPPASHAVTIASPSINDDRDHGDDDHAHITDSVSLLDDHERDHSGTIEIEMHSMDDEQPHTSTSSSSAGASALPSHLSLSDRRAASVPHLDITPTTAVSSSPDRRSTSAPHLQPSAASAPSPSEASIAVAPSMSRAMAPPRNSRTSRVWVTIKDILYGIEVPAWAALASMILGLIPFVRQVLFESPAGYFRFLVDSLTSFGDTVIPLTLLTLGVSMSDGPRPSAKLKPLTVALIVLVRLFILPLFSLLFLYLLSLANLLPLGTYLLGSLPFGRCAWLTWRSRSRQTQCCAWCSWYKAPRRPPSTCRSSRRCTTTWPRRWPPCSSTNISSRSCRSRSTSRSSSGSSRCCSTTVTNCSCYITLLLLDTPSQPLTSNRVYYTYSPSFSFSTGRFVLAAFPS